MPFPNTINISFDYCKWDYRGFPYLYSQPSLKCCVCFLSSQISTTLKVIIHWLYSLASSITVLIRSLVFINLLPYCTIILTLLSLIQSLYLRKPQLIKMNNIQCPNKILCLFAILNFYFSKLKSKFSDIILTITIKN